MTKLYRTPYKTSVKERISLVLIEELLEKPKDSIQEAIKQSVDRLTTLFFDEIRYGSKES